MSHYNDKLMHLETVLKKNTSDVKAIIQETTEKSLASVMESQRKLEEKMVQSLKSVDERLVTIEGRLDDVESSVASSRLRTAKGPAGTEGPVQPDSSLRHDMAAMK